MGRPINSRYLGVTATGTTDGTGIGEEFNINAVVYVPGATAESTEGIILRQRSETKFKVNDAPDGSGNEGVCNLSDVAVGSLSEGEMVVQGYVDGDIDNTFTISGSASPINIRKFHNRTVIDFENNRYTWRIQDLAIGTNTTVINEDGIESTGVAYSYINALVLTEI